jgi:restriction endonuclease Mrr
MMRAGGQCMSSGELLDDFSGFEFENLMEDVFRNLGYENVRQSRKTGDEGRDILMEEVIDSERRAIIVECKHTGSVGRPVVQKLHSAVSTYEFDGPKRGMVAATGDFTSPAQEYADSLRDAGDPYPIELLDGNDLREIADEIGLNFYNGRIEIVCDQTIRPSDPTADIEAPVRKAFHDINNIQPNDLPLARTHVTFQPILIIRADVSAVFETSVGVIHRIDDTSRYILEVKRGNPSTLQDSVQRLVENNHRQTTTLDQEELSAVFDEVEINRFGQTETEYKEWMVEQLQDRYTTTVEYTGDNNITYNKTCEPNQSDISVQSITPVYLPQVRQTVRLKSYEYPLEYYAAGPSRATVEDGIHRCVHCTTGKGTSHTYCANCGAISCRSHTKTERIEKTPICTGCAVTERFALKTKYFYNKENLEAFREQYAAMSLHKKVLENSALVASGVVVTVISVTVLVAVALI